MNGRGMLGVEDILEADLLKGEGVAYKGSLAYTGGQVMWAKEQWHVSYVFQPTPHLCSFRIQVLICCSFVNID